MKSIAIISLLIATVALVGGGGYFFYQNQLFEKQIADLKNEKSKVETELAVLKASDLAKDLELTRLKLKTSENDLAESKKEVVRLGSRVKTLETSLRSIKHYLSAIDAVQEVVLGESGVTKSLVASADPKVVALQDAEISGSWQEAKQNIDFERMSWQQRFFGDTISTIILRILTIIPD